MMAADQYGRVLLFMHWAMSQPEGKNIQFGELLRMGCARCKLPYPTPEVEATLLAAAFKLVGVPFTTVQA